MDPDVRFVTFLLGLVCFVLIQSFFVTPTLLLCEISLASFCCSVDTNTLTRAHTTRNRSLSHVRANTFTAIRAAAHFSLLMHMLLTLPPSHSRALFVHGTVVLHAHTHTSTHGARFKCVRVGPSHRSRITSHHCREKVNQGLLQ